ncbi:MAG: 5'-nucleotidase C-terminal domain-containing protein [Syntrophaceae bacterium]|nr:5'-nucleotidase C-terminal domain-containing protein [Syntrophaceae bacterium]
MNDTHSHLDPSIMSYSCRGRTYKLEMGGFSRLGSAIGNLRSKGGPLLFLHAGDMVQGTLYYTKYQGRADIDLLNTMGLDAATLGNHDFDGGAELTAKLVEQADFPILSTNVDASQEPGLTGKIKPYIIKTFSGEQVAIIGVTTPYIPSLSHPGGRIVFGEVVSHVVAAVREVEAKGVNKIILLTHIGYDEDLQLARTVPGIDVIIGGHSHTLLGGQAGKSDAFRSEGFRLQPAGDYPTVVSSPGGMTVLVAQAWEWGKLLGNLEVTFDEKGAVKAWQGHPLIVTGKPVPSVEDQEKTGAEISIAEGANSCLPSVVKHYEKAPRLQERLSLYSKPLDAFRHDKIATVVCDLRRSDPFGPGHLVAESMLWKTRHLNTRAALQNVGGVRCDIPAGDVTIQTVYELLPFANTIYVVELTGRQLRRTLEEMIRGHVADGRSQLIYTAGLSFRVNRRATFGKRVLDLRIKGAEEFEPVVPTALYRIAIQNYLADGGDGCRTLKRASGYRYDTGFVDTNVFMEYLKQLPDRRIELSCSAGK